MEGGPCGRKYQHCEGDEWGGEGPQPGQGLSKKTRSVECGVWKRENWGRSSRTRLTF